jgi:hypothetical protein
VRGLDIPLRFYLKDALKCIRNRLIAKNKRPDLAQIQPSGEELWTWAALFEANPHFTAMRDEENASGTGK